MTTQTKERPRIRKAKADGSAKATEGERSYKAPSRLPARRGLALALVLCLAIVGGLIAFAASSGQGGHKVLTFSADLKRGEVITADKIAGTLSVVDVPDGALAAGESAVVIGKIATFDIPRGALVLPGVYGESLGVKDGTSVVGVAVQASQLPVRALAAGDKVRVVFTPSEGASGGQGQEQSVAGTVDQVRADDGSGFTVVDVVVSAAEAGKAARWSSAKAASLVLDGGK
jgi:SAF domain